jgi:hypothetical protein
MSALGQKADICTARAHNPPPKGDIRAFSLNVRRKWTCGSPQDGASILVERRHRPEPGDDCVQVALSHAEYQAIAMGGLSKRPSRAIPLVIARLISESVHAPIPAVACDVIFVAVDFSHVLGNP